MNKTLLTLVAVILCSGPLFPFGKNKVQYQTFNWEVLKTPHFDIYYNKGQKLLAEQSALLLEDACARLSDSLRFELTRVVPVIIYNSHNDFKQSNVILDLISEGTGGFTEVFKNRIVVPFNGSYAEFRHVLHHELTHAFQFNILLGGFWESLFTRQFMYTPPLWFMEGMSEYESLGWDTESDLILRDATVNNMLASLERLEDLYSLEGFEYYLIYKGGQSFLKYIAEKYGAHKTGEIMKAFQKTRDFHNSFKAVIGKSHYDVNADWFRFLRRKYWPLVKSKKDPSETGKKLTDHLRERCFYNSKPVWSPDGKKIALLTDRHIFMNIVLIDARTGKELDVIVKSGNRADYEEMGSKYNALSWSRDGRYLLFVSKTGQYDQINIYDFKKKKVIRRVNPRLDAVYSPDLSADNRAILFSGTKNGQNDLYLADFTGGQLKKLTDDIFFDSYPVWNSTGKYIIFTSNRERGYLSANSDIFVHSVSNGSFIKIVSSSNNNYSPRLDRTDERLVFVSDRDGFPNIYMKSVDHFKSPGTLLGGEEKKLTDTVTAALDPGFSPDGKKLAFASFYKMGYDIHVMDIPERTDKDMISRSLATNSQKFEKVEEMSFGLSETRKEKYRFNLTPDWIMGGFLYSSVSGFGGFTYMGFSDLLGNHRFSLATDFLTGNNDFNFQLVYNYLANRINYGVGLFHFKDYYYHYYSPDDFSYSFELFYLRRYGISALASYPFSKFLRIDLEYLTMRYIRQSDGAEIEPVDTNLNVASLSLVHDTILWGETGPAWGFRSMLLYQKSLALTGKDWLFDMAFLDLRQYFLMSKRYTLALRAAYGSIWGRDRHENSFYIGGFNTIRGQSYLEFSGTRMFLFNLEYRYPFVNIIQVAWPFTFNIKHLRAVFFADFGSAWDNTDKWQMMRKHGGVWKFQDLKSGVGWGLRFGLYVFRFRLDFATPWDGSRIDPLSKWQGLFSIGYDF